MGPENKDSPTFSDLNFFSEVEVDHNFAPWQKFSHFGILRNKKNRQVGNGAKSHLWTTTYAFYLV